METTTYCTFSSFAEFLERVCKLHWFSYKNCHVLKYKHSSLININNFDNLETKPIMAFIVKTRPVLLSQS